MENEETRQTFHEFMIQKIAQNAQATNSDELMIAKQLKRTGVGICAESYMFTRLPSYVSIEELRKLAVEYFAQERCRLLKAPREELSEITRKSHLKLEFANVSNGRYGCVIIDYPKPTEKSNQICRLSVHRTDDWAPILEDKIQYPVDLQRKDLKKLL